jgi:gamma-glutamylcyclotransferase (GGCT)/AIG2-like uncharacterized protein YtfP
MNRVFVYGTLQPGEALNSDRTGQPLITGKPATLFGAELLIPWNVKEGQRGAYPAATPHPTKQIRGHVLAVSNSDLKGLDSIEGNGVYYTRHLRLVLVDGMKRKLKAWVYFINDVKSWKPANREIW